jgi:tetratricopeptide (TPR) repeat protein
VARLVRRLVESGRGNDALQLATAAFQAGKVKEAETIAQAALDAGLLTPQIYYLLAGAARATGRPALAVDLARVGIALDPAPESARRDVAVILLELGRAEEAAAHLEAIPADKRDRACRERLALAYALAGKRHSARSLFRDLAGEAPQDDRARAALLRLTPPPADKVLDAIAQTLAGPVAQLFARLRQGPATEADLATHLAEAGYRQVLLKALIRDLCERTRAGSTPLVAIEGESYRLDLGVLDVSLPESAPLADPTLATLDVRPG